jgi:hypothetical protein
LRDEVADASPGVVAPGVADEQVVLHGWSASQREKANGQQTTPLRLHIAALEQADSRGQSICARAATQEN